MTRIRIPDSLPVFTEEEKKRQLDRLLEELIPAFSIPITEEETPNPGCVFLLKVPEGTNQDFGIDLQKNV